MLQSVLPFNEVCDITHRIAHKARGMVFGVQDRCQIAVMVIREGGRLQIGIFIGCDQPLPIEHPSTGTQQRIGDKGIGDGRGCAKDIHLKRGGLAIAIPDGGNSIGRQEYWQRGCLGALCACGIDQAQGTIRGKDRGRTIRPNGGHDLSKVIENILRAEAACIHLRGHAVLGIVDKRVGGQVVITMRHMIDSTSILQTQGACYSSSRAGGNTTLNNRIDPFTRIQKN